MAQQLNDNYAEHTVALQRHVRELIEALRRRECADAIRLCICAVTELAALMPVILRMFKR